MDTPPGISNMQSSRRYLLLYVILILSLFGVVFYFFVSPPPSSQSMANREPTIIHIHQGEPITHIASELENDHIVRSHTVLKVILTALSADRSIERGDYKFDHPSSVLRVAWRLARGDHNVNRIRITVREGLTNDEVANILSDTMNTFRRDLFMSDPRVVQGYLFPDTYFYFPLTTTDEIVTEMTDTFKKQTRALQSEINSSGRTENEIITMASVVEKEARGEDDSSIIAGILWKRIARGMPLQVDAAKETYTMKGLPKAPIVNPGLRSITAALHPQDSPYLFYLHAKDGTVHYAKTFAEHKANITRYLK